MRINAPVVRARGRGHRAEELADVVIGEALKVRDTTGVVRRRARHAVRSRKTQHAVEHQPATVPRHDGAGRDVADEIPARIVGLNDGAVRGEEILAKVGVPRLVGRGDVGDGPLEVGRAGREDGEDGARLRDAAPQARVLEDVDGWVDLAGQPGRVGERAPCGRSCPPTRCPRSPARACPAAWSAR